MNTEYMLQVLALLLTNLVAISVMIRKKLQSELEPIKNNTNSLLPNGGASLSDKITKTYENVVLLQNSIKELNIWKKAWMELYNAPIFITNNLGHCVWVNNKYLKLTGTSFEELIGNNWIKCIHDEDREDVVRQWDFSIQNNNIFHKTYRIVNQHSGVTTKVECRSIKLGDTVDNSGYIGVLYLSN